MKRITSQSKSRRPGGGGKAIDTPSIGNEGSLSGMDQLTGGPEGGAGERGTKPYDFDGSYAGNVRGCCSKPVSLGVK
jgi:hypothetical protein